MTDKNTNKDPEGLDDESGSTGGDEFYDNLAVESLPYVHSQFELPEDHEVVGDPDE